MLLVFCRGLSADDCLGRIGGEYVTSSQMIWLFARYGQTPSFEPLDRQLDDII